MAERVTFFLPPWATTVNEALQRLAESEALEIEDRGFYKGHFYVQVEALENPHDNALVDFLVASSTPFDLAHEGDDMHSPGEVHCRVSEAGEVRKEALSAMSAHQALEELLVAYREDPEAARHAFSRLAEHLETYSRPLESEVPCADYQQRLEQTLSGRPEAAPDWMKGQPPRVDPGADEDTPSP